MRQTFLRENGKKKVKIERDAYGTVLLVTRNGYQWSGAIFDNGDDEVLDMIIDVIDDYKKANS